MRERISAPASQAGPIHQCEADSGWFTPFLVGLFGSRLKAKTTWTGGEAALRHRPEGGGVHQEASCAILAAGIPSPMTEMTARRAPSTTGGGGAPRRPTIDFEGRPGTAEVRRLHPPSEAGATSPTIASESRLPRAPPPEPDLTSPHMSDTSYAAPEPGRPA